MAEIFDYFKENFVGIFYNCYIHVYMHTHIYMPIHMYICIKPIVWQNMGTACSKPCDTLQTDTPGQTDTQGQTK